MLYLFLIFLWVGNGVSADRKVVTDGPGDCRQCHQNESILGADHVSTQSMRMDGCLECHEKEEMSLDGKISGSHLHLLRGVFCSDCHGEKKIYGLVGTDRCLKCHINGQKVAALTDTLDPNPHDSIHYGQDLDCDLCHHIHKKSEIFCNQCHDFTNITP